MENLKIECYLNHLKNLNQLNEIQIDIINQSIFIDIKYNENYFNKLIKAIKNDRNNLNLNLELEIYKTDYINQLFIDCKDKETYKYLTNIIMWLPEN